MTGLEPVRRSTHAPQTCLSTSSSTLALISRGEPLVSQRQDIFEQGYAPLSTKFSKKFEKFSNAENYFQNRRKSTLFRALSSAFGGMKNCRPSGNSVSRQKFFIFLQRCYASTSCTLPRPSLRMERALRSGRWDSFSAEKPRRLKHATGMFLRAAFRIPPSVKNKDHPDGWSLFWRRRWDSNPRGVLPPTRFRVELVMTTSILLRIAPVLQALIYSIMQ